LVKDFAAWRLDWYTTRFEHNHQRDLYELTFWLAVKALFESQFPKRLGGFKDRASLQADVATTVAKRTKLILDDTQIDRIANLPTYRWNKEYAQDVELTIERLRAAIEEYKAILASPDRLRTEYLNELDHLKRLS
jgi:hypothetical protein